MKRTILSLAMALTSFVGALAQSSQESVINVTANGIPDGTELQAMLAATHRDEKPLATAVVQDGKATLKVPVSDPRLIGVLPTDSYFLFQVMTQGGETVNVSLDAKKYDDGTNNGFETSNITISGSALNGEFDKRFTAVHNEMNKKYAEYHEQFKNLLDEEQKAWAAKDTLKRKQIHETARYKEFEKAETDFFNGVDAAYNKMIADNKDSWWGPLVMLCAYSYFTEEQKPMWAQFSKEAQESFYGQVLGEQINPKGFTGEALPQFDLQQADGTKMPMAKAVAGKKYYLVDFWASWCGPCRKEIPNLKKLYEQYKGKGLEIVSVSIDKDEKAWRKALKEEQLPWPNGLDRAEISNAYKVQFIPAIFLVDGATGKCIAENIRGEELAKKLASLLDN